MDICMEIPRKDSNWPVQNFYIPLNIFGAMLPTYRCFCNFEMFSFRKLSFLNLFLSWTLKKQFTQNHTMCERNRKKKNPTCLNLLSKWSYRSRECPQRRWLAIWWVLLSFSAWRTAEQHTQYVTFVDSLLVENTTYIEKMGEYVKK